MYVSKTLVFGTETMGKKIPEERLLDLQKRLDLLPPRNTERMKMIQVFADLYAVSVNTVYRGLSDKRGSQNLSVALMQGLPEFFQVQRWNCIVRSSLP
jgi:hypothetical protein